jgi:hypothetical protein
VKAGKALLQIASTPFTNGLNTEIYFFSDGEIGSAFGGHQNNTGPSDKAMGKGTRINHRFQSLVILHSKDKRGFRSTCSHGLSPFEIRMSP